jgi:hypothetical protein
MLKACRGEMLKACGGKMVLKTTREYMNEYSTKKSARL